MMCNIEKLNKIELGKIRTLRLLYIQIYIFFVLKIYWNNVADSNKDIAVKWLNIDAVLLSLIQQSNMILDFAFMRYKAYKGEKIDV